MVNYSNSYKSTSPATGGVLITPGTAALERGVTRALWVGGAGNINVTFESGETVLLSGVVAGSLLPISVSHVLATSTTATSIVALY